MRLEYQDTCTVRCSNNGREVVADVLDFIPEKKLTVALNRSVKLTLVYNGKLYTGRNSGLEFESIGPQTTVYRDGRR